MIKLVKIVLSALTLFSFAVSADPASELKEKLDSFDSLSASFTQEVRDAGGSVLSSSSGRLFLKKPKAFLIKTESPDETSLYTRDDGIYYYDSFINQLSIYALSSLENEPFALLYSKEDGIWDNYAVEKSKDGFFLTTKKHDAVKAVALGFDKESISRISIFMKDGNTNIYNLNNVKFEVDAGVFNVKLPSDVEINDER